jgi:dynactin complex subunit
MPITEKFTEHFERVAQAHDAEDWDKVAELQTIERQMFDESTPEEQYEYYLRVAKDHTGVDVEKIDRALSAMCLSDDIEVKGNHLRGHFLHKFQALLIRAELADQKFEEFKADMTAFFNQDVKPLPKGFISPVHTLKS